MAGKGASQIEMYRDVFVMMVLELDKNLWPVVVWYFEGKEYLFMDHRKKMHLPTLEVNWLITVISLVCHW